MDPQENIEIVKQTFANFERGAITEILNMLTDDVKWQTPVTRTAHQYISWSKERRGPDQVLECFKELGGKVKTEPFENLVFTAQDDRVVVEGRNRGTVIATNLSYEHDWLMIFYIRDGKISQYRHYYYTRADLVSAFRYN